MYWIRNRVRVEPITHIAQDGTLLCEGRVLCGDYRPGESVGATYDMATCYGCRGSVIESHKESK